MQWIDAEAIRRHLPMAACIDAMAQAMQAVSAGAVTMPPRLMAHLEGGIGQFGVMPADSAALNLSSAKLITLRPDNASSGLPNIQGVIVLFQRDSGEPLAMLDGAAITTLRTAAVSGLATRLLAREDCRSCGILGTGVQAVSHIEAMLAARPIERVVVWGRDAAKTRDFVFEQSGRFECELTAGSAVADAAACDVVCTVTGSQQPLLLGQDVLSGAHINLVGSHTPDAREADSALMMKASVYFDQQTAMQNEAGDVLIPLAETAISINELRGELGALIDGSIPGRTAGEEVTVFKSVGLAAQDLYAAAAVFEAATDTN